jgi:putative transposase
LCEVFDVGRSGYYDYVARQQATCLEADELRLRTRVRAIHAETGQSYGSRRMAKQLQDEGFAVGRCKTRRLMKEEGISVKRRFSRRPQTTDSRHGYGVAPNLLDRRFDVDRPNVAWCGDITSLWTNDGWWYLSVLLDVYARKVVGWAMSDHIATPLVTNALKRAVGRRNPTPGLMHHSDRGAQYAAQAYRRLLSDDGIECSMSRKGDCLDKAVAERFFGSVKREWTANRRYATRQDARDDVIDDIERFYNSRRQHSYLGYVSPNEYEKIAQAA